MREKIEKILFIFAEIGTVIWATTKMLSNYRFCGGLLSLSSSCDYPISPVLAYFLSAVLILYLLRKYRK